MRTVSLSSICDPLSEPVMQSTLSIDVSFSCLRALT